MTTTRALAAALCLCCTTLLAEDSTRVLKNSSESPPASMMQDWLMKRAEEAFGAWQKRYDELKTPEQIADYQRQLRARFVEQVGGFPERTSLNLKVTGVVARDGYRVEKILFESQPNQYVSGLCFVPHASGFRAPYPAVLIVCGHNTEGKQYVQYQQAAALLALNGIVGFVVDAICQGERCQHVENGKPLRVSATSGHTMLGLGSILLGQNIARTLVWDGMRAIDSLPSWETVVTSLRPEDQLVNCIHGALRSYDLSDLIQYLGERVRVLHPVNALREAIED